MLGGMRRGGGEDGVKRGPEEVKLCEIEKQG